MRRNVVVLLIAGLGGAWWIGSLVTGMLHSQLDIVVEKNVLQSTGMKEPATVNVVSPFDVIETGSMLSKVQSQTGASASELIPNPEAIEHSRQKRSRQKRSPKIRSLDMILGQPLNGESETALLRNLQAWSVAEPAQTALWIERTLSEASPGSAATHWFIHCSISG